MVRMSRAEPSWVSERVPEPVLARLARFSTQPSRVSVPVPELTTWPVPKLVSVSVPVFVIAPPSGPRLLRCRSVAWRY